MKLHVMRNPFTDNGTPGLLSVLENGYACDTLELPWRNNQTGISCIMPDTYKLWPWFSPTLQRLVLRLEDKHGRKDCLIHNANFAALDNPDTPEHEITQVHGCTAVGRGYGKIQKKDGTLQWGILNSVTTLTKLVQLIGEGPHTITYEWAPNAIPDDLRDLNPLSEGA